MMIIILVMITMILLPHHHHHPDPPPASPAQEDLPEGAAGALQGRGQGPHHDRRRVQHSPIGAIGDRARRQAQEGVHE
jgi:hypothetical protein